MVDIYSENLFWTARFKNRLKSFLSRQNRGPKQVFMSLTRGLKELGVDFQVNRPVRSGIKTACVISGAATLRWAIRQKQAGRIKKIMAGPNIVVFPQDEQGVLLNRMVDMVIVPSEWVKELYLSMAPELAGKIRVWPAGVEVPRKASVLKDVDFLVYNKIGSAGLAADIIEYLKSRNNNVEVLNYGKFKQEEYFFALDRSKFEIYLSNSESQGLAMFEAWARGVPTLVWERGYFELKGKHLAGNTASPYLSPQAGARFKDFQGFKSVMPEFLSAIYKPKAYVEGNFTDAKCALGYLEILGNDNAR